MNKTEAENQKEKTSGLSGDGSRNKLSLSEQDRKAMSKFWSLGIEFVGVTALFGFFGYKADQYFDTLPWMTIVAILFALTGLVYQLIKDLGSLD